MTRGVCIVECLDKDDPGSEGRALKEIFNLMEVDSELVRVKSIFELFEAIAETAFPHVHVSTHGVTTDADKFGGWWTHRGRGSKSVIQEIDLEFSCTSIVSTACKSGSREFAEYVLQLGSRFYIAPTGKPTFYNAALFSHIYYHKLFKTKKSVRKAFSSYEDGYKNPHGFRIFPKSPA